MKHLSKKREGKSRKSMSRPHGNRRNKVRVDKKTERQDADKEIMKTKTAEEELKEIADALEAMTIEELEEFAKNPKNIEELTKVDKAINELGEAMKSCGRCKCGRCY